MRSLPRSFICLIETDVVRSEERETVIGMTSDRKLLGVNYIFRTERVRLISARTVTIKERNCYEEQCSPCASP